MTSSYLAPNRKWHIEAYFLEGSNFIPGLVCTYCSSYTQLLSGFDVLFILNLNTYVPSETKVS
jgi:hypothetical protein